MKYFITGIAGFIGTHLSRKLLEDGHQIVAQVRDKLRGEELIKQGVEVVFGDLSLFKDKYLVLPQVDCVIPLAGVIAADTLEQYDQINYQSVVDLVECLHRQSWSPKKFIFASSLAAAGSNVDGIPHSETTPCFQATSYRASLIFITPVTTTLFMTLPSPSTIGVLPQTAIWTKSGLMRLCKPIKTSAH